LPTDLPKTDQSEVRVFRPDVVISVAKDVFLNPSDSRPDARGRAAEVGPYRDAVLKIKTPVRVTLARKKESLRRILNLVPGAMLTFDAHCDEPLLMEAGERPIARGETVKIGDKFGMRIRHLIGQSDSEG